MKKNLINIALVSVMALILMVVAGIQAMKETNLAFGILAISFIPYIALNIVNKDNENQVINNLGILLFYIVVVIAIAFSNLNYTSSTGESMYGIHETNFTSLGLYISIVLIPYLIGNLIINQKLTIHRFIIMGLIVLTPVLGIMGIIISVKAFIAYSVILLIYFLAIIIYPIVIYYLPKKDKINLNN